MKTVAATEAKNRFGAIIDDAQREPVVIRRQDRDVAVVLSMADYSGCDPATPRRSSTCAMPLRRRLRPPASPTTRSTRFCVPTARDRVVIDTNVFISGVLSTTSAPARCIETVASGGQLIATEATLKELFERLLSAKFDPYVTRARREELLSRLAPLVEIVEVVQQVRACRDPHDDKFLEAAVNGRADVIITGDKDLLELHPFRGIAIVRPGRLPAALKPKARRRAGRCAIRTAPTNLRVIWQYF